jgi:hypothetical protein
MPRHRARGGGQWRGGRSVVAGKPGTAAADVSQVEQGILATVACCQRNRIVESVRVMLFNV